MESCLDTWGLEIDQDNEIFIAVESEQETLEEAAERYVEEHGCEESDPWFDFMEGAKWQAEQNYIQQFIKQHNITEQTLVDVYEEYLRNALEQFNSKNYSKKEVVELLHEYREFAWKNGSTISDLQQWIQEKLQK
jgi:hypothetical protein